MKQQKILLAVISLLILANWGSEESNVAGGKTQAVNFYGTLQTYDNDKEYNVDNITINNMYKNIEVYDMPANLDTKTHTLEQDPLQGIKTFINLSEISELSAPDHQITWTYQKDKNDRLTKYIEIKIISNGTQKTANSYLIGAERKIMCKEVNPKNPKEVPLRGVKKLVIAGYEHRDGSNSKDCNKMAKKNDDA